LSFSGIGHCFHTIFPYGAIVENERLSR
jgi:hypothetical protein